MKKGFMFGGAFLPNDVVKNFPKKNPDLELTAIADTYGEIRDKYGIEAAEAWYNSKAKRTLQECVNSGGPLYITRVLYNDPITVVFWNDNTKTAVRCSDKDAYCREAGLAMCVLRKMIGTAAFKNLIEDWSPEQYYDNLTDENAEVTMKDVRRKHKHMD